MFSTPNTAPVGSPRELLNGGSAWNARYRYEEPSTRTRSGREVIFYFGGGAAPLSFFFSGAVTSGAGVDDAGAESGVCGELGAPVFSEAGGVAAGRVTTSVGVSGR